MGCSMSLMSRVLLAIGEELGSKGQTLFVDKKIDMNGLIAILEQCEKSAVPFSEEDKKRFQDERFKRVMAELEDMMENGGQSIEQIVEELENRGFDNTSLPVVPSKPSGPKR